MLRCYVDIDRFMEVCLSMSNAEKLENSSITEVWENDGINSNGLMLRSKELSEYKSSISDGNNSMRFELLTMLLKLVTDEYMNDDGLIAVKDVEDMLFGQRIGFDTLVRYGIIRLIDDH